MKNREKFRAEILNWVNKSGGNDEPYCEFARKNVIPSITNCQNGGCAEFTCSCCRAIFAFWLGEEYEEPEVDWNSVPVDTLVRVRDNESEEWTLMYFKGINEKSPSYKFQVWIDGATSKTASGGNYVHWKYCKLVEDEDDCN